MHYIYDEFDQALVQARVTEFSAQVARRLEGKLSEEEFKPLRLMNGLYLQLHAYMLRVAIPYGELQARQLRLLADIADRYDQGYGHFATRQNIQFNWIKLTDAPAILQELANGQMHAIQTSGNCIRNVTADPFAGAAQDEVIDPRPIAELLRQWSTLHPEYAYLPRKFKFAISGSAHDRAAVAVHDIGLKATSLNGQIGVQIWVGGGQGRTPKLAKLLFDFVAIDTLIPTLEAILRVYNEAGRRDNKYKARIKILVNAMGIADFKTAVQKCYAQLDPTLYKEVTTVFAAIKAQFDVPLPPASISDTPDTVDTADTSPADPAFLRWMANNLHPHKDPTRSIVSISLKPNGGIPGDATSAQMRHIATLAEQHSLGMIRVTHRQNLVLPHVPKSALYALWQQLCEINLAEANIDHASDIIACPGLDYCALATARSIPIAQALSHSILTRPDADTLGDISINISGCINACGHHHVANIGLLGLNKGGEEYYQVTVGGSARSDAAIGERLGPGLSGEQVVVGVHRMLDHFISTRSVNETFVHTLRRTGATPFMEALYAAN